MKIKLANEKKSCTEYGITFDSLGFAESDCAQSLIDAGKAILVEEKKAPAKKRTTK